MQNRTPVAREARPALPDFTPVPRKYRHDGWTPERQKAFIEALADTGSVSRAAGMCNMAQANCYTLRRAPGAEEFRRAWDAALDYGVQRLKDIAFERAIEGELLPVFVAGKLLGFRRKRNDALLMFCLRHYGQDAEGRRTTINYVSTRASAGAGATAGSGQGAVAEATTTTMRTVLTGAAADGTGTDAAARIDALTASLSGFAGVPLDAQAQDAVMAALEACATRERERVAALDLGGEDAADAAEDDPTESFVRVAPDGDPFRGTLLPASEIDDFEPFDASEPHWSEHGADVPAWVTAAEDALAPSRAVVEADTGVAAVKRPRRKSGWGKSGASPAKAGAR